MKYGKKRKCQNHRALYTISRENITNREKEALVRDLEVWRREEEEEKFTSIHLSTCFILFHSLFIRGCSKSTELALHRSKIVVNVDNK